MSRRLYVKGFKKPSEVWEKMASVWHACDAARVSVPDEVQAFFDDFPPNRDRFKTGIPNQKRTVDSIEIRVEDIPDGVDVIKFWIED